MTDYEQTCLVFAARYTHSRDTGGASVVISVIMNKWPLLSTSIREQVQREAKNEATANRKEWQWVIDK